MTTEPSVTGELEATLEEIDNPIERLKLLSGNEQEISKYLDAIEVTSPREREMLHEISRTRPLARPDVPQAHRNMVEALESLARHGYHGTSAGSGSALFGGHGPLGCPARCPLPRRVPHPEHVDPDEEPLRPPRDPALPGTDERRELRARPGRRADGRRARDEELGVPAFVSAAGVPVLAALGGRTGLLESTLLATMIGVVGMLIALAASWVILRGAALASRRIRLATRPAAGAVEGDRLVRQAAQGPDADVRLRLHRTDARRWIIVPILVGIAVVDLRPDRHRLDGAEVLEPAARLEADSPAEHRAAGRVALAVAAHLRGHERDDPGSAAGGRYEGTNYGVYAATSRGRSSSGSCSRPDTAAFDARLADRRDHRDSLVALAVCVLVKLIKDNEFQRSGPGSASGSHLRSC